MPAPRAALGLWAVVLVQLAIPASYYLRDAAADDERFAWRMFSAVRFRKCEVEAYEAAPSGRRALDLDRELHASWVGLLRRGRPAVIASFLRSRCHQPRLQTASLRRSCREIDGVGRFVERYGLECATGQLSREQEPR